MNSLDAKDGTTATRSASTWRRMPIGAEAAPEGGVDFRFWAPKRGRVEVVYRPEATSQARTLVLEREGNGYYSERAEQTAPGTRYRFRLDDEPLLIADPASRFQPGGPHADSEVIDPDAFVGSGD